MKFAHNDQSIILENKHDRLFVYINDKMYLLQTNSNNLILNAENGFELKHAPLLTSIRQLDDKSGLILDVVKKQKRLRK